MTQLKIIKLNQLILPKTNNPKNKQPNPLKDFNKIILFLPNNKCTHQRPTKK